VHDPAQAIGGVQLVADAQLQQHIRDEDHVDGPVHEEKGVRPASRRSRRFQIGHLDRGDQRGEYQRERRHKVPVRNVVVGSRIDDRALHDAVK
jgi:hypothetical protein